MATAPAPPMRARREMQEVNAPDQFQFTEMRRTLSGILIDIDQVTVKDKPTMQYTFRDEDGKRTTFLATYDLQRKIEPGHIGHWMTITYEGEDHTIKTQGSPLRKFKVQASKEKEPGF
jgi:hypothetical protein